jgi:hypothetical protein
MDFRAAFKDLLGTSRAVQSALSFLTHYHNIPTHEQTQEDRLRYCEIWYHIARFMQAHPRAYQRLHLPLRFVLTEYDVETGSYALNLVVEVVALSQRCIENVTQWWTDSQASYHKTPQSKSLLAALNQLQANEQMSQVLRTLTLVACVRQFILPKHPVCLKIEKSCEALQQHHHTLRAVACWLSARHFLYHAKNNNPHKAIVYLQTLQQLPSGDQLTKQFQSLAKMEEALAHAIYYRQRSELGQALAWYTHAKTLGYPPQEVLELLLAQNQNIWKVRLSDILRETLRIAEKELWVTTEDLQSNLDFTSQK